MSDESPPSDKDKASTAANDGEPVVITGEENKHTNGAATSSGEAKVGRFVHQMEELKGAVKRLEGFAVKEARRVSKEVVPAAEARVRNNLWVSLLMALGLGLVLGLVLGMRRRSDG
ncbi:MAG: hypothetical protein U0271_16640 [Polyangiaceae bacterium]